MPCITTRSVKMILLDVNEHGEWIHETFAALDALSRRVVQACPDFSLFDEILPLLPDRVAMVRGQGDILQHDGQAGEERRDGEERGVARRWHVACNV